MVLPALVLVAILTIISAEEKVGSSSNVSSTDPFISAEEEVESSSNVSSTDPFISAEEEVESLSTVSSEDNGGDFIASPICDSLTDEDVDGYPQILGEMPKVLMIYNDTDSESIDIACVLKAAAPDAEGVQIVDKHCMQLLTIDAVPEEIHVVITRGGYNVPFCDAQVYGAIPSVVEVRLTTSDKWTFSKYVTFNMITNGGHLRFDLETYGDNAGRNMLDAFRTLMSIAISGRPYQNGFPNFHRASHLRSKPELGHAKDVFLRKLDVALPFSTICMITYIPVFIFASVVSFLLVMPYSRQGAHIEGFEMDLDDMRPEQLPSLYGQIQKNALEKVIRGISMMDPVAMQGGSGSGSGSNDSKAPKESNDPKGLLELQKTMDEEATLTAEETQHSIVNAERKDKLPAPQGFIALNLLEPQPLQNIK